jgi:hypothetical protein
MLKVSGCIRLVRGELARNDRDVALGRLQHTAGVLQQRRGVVTWRLERARKRLAARTQDQAPQAR